MTVNSIIQEEVSKMLNEMSIRSLSSSNIITPKYIEEVKMSDGYERFIEYYKYEENLVDEDNDEIEKTENFQNWFEYELRIRYDDAVDIINDHINSDGTIDIWRMMKVTSEWLENLTGTGKHLGIYWSWEEDAAEAHWGHGGGKYLTIKSSVREEYVNWEDTIMLNMNIDLGDEKEIRLYKNTKLKIEDLEFDGKTVDLYGGSGGQIISDKEFYA